MPVDTYSKDHQAGEDAMSTNRIAKYSDMSDNTDAPSEPSLRGFRVNPLGPTITSWQIQFYQAAFMQAQQELDAEQNAWGEWSI